MAAHARLLQSLRLISRAPDLRDVARCIEANAAAACIRGYSSVRLQQVARHNRSTQALADGPPPPHLHRHSIAVGLPTVATPHGPRVSCRRRQPQTPVHCTAQ